MGLTRIRAEQISDIDYKQAVRAIELTNVTLAGGAPSQVDGVSLNIGDRILVVGQGTASQNGLYDVTVVGSGSNGTWVRTPDANATGEINAGMIVMVAEGNTYADTSWKLVTNNPIVIGTTSLSFLQNTGNSFSVINADGTNILANGVSSTVNFVAGNNITITSNAASDTITFSAAGSDYGNANVTALLNTGLSGNIIPSVTNTYTLGNLTNQWAELYLSGNSVYFNGIALSGNTTTLTYGGNAVIVANSAGSVSILGNVTADYFIGDGSLLTNLPVQPGTYGNANVADYLPTYTGNITANNISATSNVTASTFVTSGTQGNIIGANIVSAVTFTATGNIYADGYFIGDGSQLTNLPIGDYGNANVAAYLPTYTGDFTANNISASGQITGGNLLINGNSNILGNLNVQGNITFINSNVIVTDDLYIELANNQSTYANINGAGLQVGNTGTQSLTNWTYSTTANAWTTNVGISATGNISSEQYFVGNGAYITNLYGSTINVNIGLQAGKTSQGGNAIAIGAYAGANTQSANAVAIGREAAQTTQGLEAIAIGRRAGSYIQSANAVAIGTFAGSSSQNIDAIAIGLGAASNNQSESSIAIGSGAASNSQGSSSIAIGHNAGTNLQGNLSIAIGQQAGRYSQLANSIAIGFNAGNSTQQDSAIAVGFNAGNINQGESAIAFGRNAGNISQGANAIAFGRNAGNITQGINAIAIGKSAGNISQGNTAVALGHLAGADNQGANAVAIGAYAGYPISVENSIAINGSAGNLPAPNAGFYVNPVRNDNSNVDNVVYFNTTTSELTYGPTGDFTANTITANTFIGDGTQISNVANINSGTSTLGFTAPDGNIVGALGGVYGLEITPSTVSIGYAAGVVLQGANAVALGTYAGFRNQGAEAISIGAAAGYWFQSAGAISLGGDDINESSQGVNAVSIGFGAGTGSQGANSVALGAFAGASSQPASSIFINASGNPLSGTNSGLYVNPVRYDFGNITTGLYYNASTNEITYGPTSGVANIISNGTSSVSIPEPDGSVNISAEGITNLAVFAQGTMTLQGPIANPKVLTGDIIVAENVNAMLIGPIVFSPTEQMTVPDSSTVYIFGA